MRQAEHVAHMGGGAERRNVYRVSVGKAARKLPLGRPWHR